MGVGGREDIGSGSGQSSPSQVSARRDHDCGGVLVGAQGGHEEEEEGGGHRVGGRERHREAQEGDQAQEGAEEAQVGRRDESAQLAR